MLIDPELFHDSRDGKSRRRVLVTLGSASIAMRFRVGWLPTFALPAPVDHFAFHYDAPSHQRIMFELEGVDTKTWPRGRWSLRRRSCRSSASS